MNFYISNEYHIILGYFQQDEDKTYLHLHPIMKIILCRIDAAAKQSAAHFLAAALKPNRKLIPG